jgi:hypothetical protein
MAELASAAASSVVLVHGGFVDGSGWESVYEILRKDGYVVSIVQNPTTSLADDVAHGRRRREMFIALFARELTDGHARLASPERRTTNPCALTPCS